MPSLDDVYRKFGETSEAAQLLETQLGTMLIWADCLDADLIENPDSEKANEIYKKINKQTLGSLINKLGDKDSSIEQLEGLLMKALTVRNKLAHSFYMKHNFRRNSEEGRAKMIEDLESMHEHLLDAYKAVMLLSGVDIDKMMEEQEHAPLPTSHYPL